jgi:hypothetical protein
MCRGAPKVDAMRDEVIMRFSALTASAVAIGLAATVAACSSGGHTTASANSPQAGTGSASPGAAGPASAVPASASPASTGVPAGYQRVGGSAQGISIAVPRSWAAVDLAKESVRQASARLGLNGANDASVVQAMESLQKLHGLFVVDLRPGVIAASRFATNLNAYCINSNLPDSGSAGVPILRQEALTEFQQLHAGHITQKDIRIGGVPGVQTSYTLSSAGPGTLEAAQLEVLPKPNKGCFVTLTAARGQFPRSLLPVVAATAVFS